MRFRALLSVSLIAFAISACGARSSTVTPSAVPSPTASPTGVQSGEATVLIQMNAFNPAHLIIRVGTKVTWINKDISSQSAHADGGLFNSGLIPNGQAYSFTFLSAGTYPYYCDQYGGPGGQGMSGVVEVVP